MPKQIKLKTSKNDASVEAFLDTVEPEQLRQDSFALLALFRSKDVG